MLTLGRRAIQKAGEHRPHSAPTPPERVTGRLAASARVAGGRCGRIGQFMHLPTERRARGGPSGRGALERNAPNLLADHLYLWETTVVPQAMPQGAPPRRAR